MGQEKLAKLGIKRDNDLMYYIKKGDVWASPRKKPGSNTKGKGQKVADAGIEMDYSKYLYFLDSDGDVARKERQVGGSKRKGKKAKKTTTAKKKGGAKKTAAKKGGKKKAGKKKKR
jgi:hypothetical protein